MESELFGHVKGAFTGAHRDRVGRFQAASGGTLFLDEIGDISLDTQIKLLRVLQERGFEPVGGTQTIQVDVRVIAATHQDLEKLIAQGRFREDLYYRLNVIGIVMPPLRERTEDILELALHFLMRSAQKCGKRITHIEPEALSALERHLWPGNVRELENVIERAVVMAETDRITLLDLPAEIARPLRLESRRRRIETARPPSLADGSWSGFAPEFQQRLCRRFDRRSVQPGEPRLGARYASRRFAQMLRKQSESRAPLGNSAEHVFQQVEEARHPMSTANSAALTSDTHRRRLPS